MNSLLVFLICVCVCVCVCKSMETFPAVAARVLQEFRVLLQHSPSPLGSTRLLQIITINMFTIHYAQSRGNTHTHTHTHTQIHTDMLSRGVNLS